MGNDINRLDESSFNALTWREQEILSLLAQRLSDREIADELKVRLLRWIKEIESEIPVIVSADTRNCFQRRPD